MNSERDRAEHDEDQAEQRAGELERLALRFVLQQLGEDGDEGGAERGVGEQARTRFGTWKAIVNAENGPAGGEVARRDDLADEAGDPREARRDREDRRVASAIRGAAAASVRLDDGRSDGGPRRRRAIVRAAAALPRPLASWPTSTPRRSGSCAPSVSASRTAATRRRSRRTSAASRPRRPATTTPADAEHRQLVQPIDKAVKRGALHRNTGARKKSRAAAPAPRRLRLTRSDRVRRRRLERRAPAPRAACPRRGVARSRLAAAARRGSRARGRRAARARGGSASRRACRRRPAISRSAATRAASAGPCSTCAGDSPASSASAISSASRRRRAMREQAGQRARPAARSSSSARIAAARRRRRARRPASTSLRSAELAHGSSTSSAPSARAGAVLERELLELAQQPLLALADLRDQRLGAGLVELEAELAARAADPARQLPRLDAALLGDLAAGRPRPPCAAPAGTLARPSSRAKNATVGLGVDALQRGGDRPRPRRPSSARRRRRSRSAGPIANVIARERRGDRVGRARVALEHLDAAGAALAPRPARAAARGARRCGRGRRRGSGRRA